MPLFNVIGRRWEREKQERIEKERLFDVEERGAILVLVKRHGPVLTRAIPAAIFAILWPLINWYIYQTPTNHRVWIGWVILWCLIVPAFAVPTLYEAWRVRRGDVWIVDGKRCCIEHNGVLVGRFSQMQYVRAWTEAKGDADPISRLAFVGGKGEDFIIGDNGNLRENWDELTDLAQRIASMMRVPVKIEK